jgi:S-methylmethionine-dependent homocysteine/selenocysteine methylase
MAKETAFIETKQSGGGTNLIKKDAAGLEVENKHIFQTKEFAPAKYRNDLPQLSDDIFLTDGGLETTLIFHKGVDLPYFASFPLLEKPAGIQLLRDYYRQYAALARNLEVGFIFESVTWRANPDWAAKLGYSEKTLNEANRQAINFLNEIRKEFETEKSKMVISGCVGPRGDGYSPLKMMTAAEAQEYHRAQINVFSETQADMVSGFTLNYVEEAIGIALAAKSAKIPAVLSFTVETDGNLPSGQTLKEAIEKTDKATDDFPAYYMINCAHPTHFENVVTNDEPWLRRIRGIRANSSVKSHAELNESDALDEGNPAELGQQYQGLLGKLTNLRILGGCCGTDFRHIQEIAKACIHRSSN